MSTPRLNRAGGGSRGNARTIAVALAAVALGAVVLAKGLPRSSGPKVSTNSSTTTGTKTSSGASTTVAGADGSSSSTAPPTTVLDVKSKKVVVANGAQVEGIAGRMSDVLNKRGYATITPQTVKTPQPASAVFFVAGAEVVAQKVAADLGIKTVGAMPAVKPVETADAQILVVLGKDFNEAKVPPAAAATTPAASVAPVTVSSAVPPSSAVVVSTTKKP